MKALWIRAFLSPRLGVAVGSTLLACLVRIALRPWFDHQYPFATFYIAVIVSVWYGGWRSALLATGLGYVLAKWFLLEPRPLLLLAAPDQWIGSLIYFLLALTIVFFGGRMQWAQRRAEAHAQQALQTRQQAEETCALLAAIVRSSDDAILSKDLDGLITSWNAGAERMFGYTAAEVIGRSIAMLMPPGRMAEQELILERIAAGYHVEHYETVRLHKDGTPVEVSLCISPIKDASGRVIGASKVARDISEKKRAERALQEVREQLEQEKEALEKRVAERTAQLKETIGELESFSYSITHDMRAPLRAMQRYAKLLLDEFGERVGDTGQDYLRRLVTSAHRLDCLIVDALNYSCFARAELELQPIDVQALLQGILQTYLSFQPPRAEISVEGRLPLVLGNEAALTQCISNLLDNAVKFVAPGVQPRVRVWAEKVRSAECGVRNEGNGERRMANGEWEAQRAHDLTIQRSNDVTLPTHHPPSTPQPSTLSGPAGERVRIWFEDNGIGIEPEAHERIFGLFQRLHTNYEGTGLGLAIVRTAAQRMEGAVGVESEPGRGSRFWIELKRASPGATETAYEK